MRSTQFDKRVLLAADLRASEGTSERSRAERVGRASEGVEGPERDINSAGKTLIIRLSPRLDASKKMRLDAAKNEAATGEKA
jgi:hypothetical protein